MKTTYRIIIAFVLLGITSCSTPYVAMDYDREVNFDQIKTYNYFSDIEWGNLNKLDQSRFIKAVDAELAAKGFVKSENPQVLIDIQPDQKMVKRSNASVGVGGGGFGRHTGVGVSLGIPISTKKSQKNYVVEMLSADTQNLIWQGVYQRDFSPNKSNTEIIPKAVADLFKKFPPEKK